jgi:hypothetical protein
MVLYASSNVSSGGSSWPASFRFVMALSDDDLRLSKESHAVARTRFEWRGS